jgi:2-oxoglutarate ferredoxin oxidoreductase subunit beta
MIKPGFSFIDVIAPCPPIYGRMNKMPLPMDSMRYYQEKTIIRHGADPKEADITLNGPILAGKFVDIERPTFQDQLDHVSSKVNAKV